jgi:hypothetical protein
MFPDKISLLDKGCLERASLFYRIAAERGIL